MTWAAPTPPALAAPSDPPSRDVSFARAFRLGVALRWRLTRNRLRKGGLFLFVLAIVVAALSGLGGFALFASARLFDDPGRRSVLLVAITLLVLGWVFVPLVGGGADETVDPTRLALLPLRSRQLLAVIGGSAASGPASLAVFVALCGVPVGYAPGSVAGVVVVVAAVPVMFLVALGFARVVAAALVRTQRSRKGRDLAVLVSGVAGVTLWLASQSIGPLIENGSSEAGNTLLDVFAWMPSGWAPRGVVAASEGRTGVGALWVLAGATVAAAALLGWGAITKRLLTAPERTIGARAADGRPPLGTAAGPRQASLAKEFRTAARSPGKRVQFLLGTLMGVGFALIQVTTLSATDRPNVVFLGMWASLLSIGGSFNVIGFDSPSLWLEVTAGGPGRDQLFARTAAWLPHLLVPPVLGVLLIATWTGQWSLVPVALPVAVTIALTGLGAAAVVSSLAPVPFTDGDNPFSWRQGMSGKGCITAMYTLAGLAVVGLLAAPVLVPVVVGHERWWALPLALTGMGWGLGCWALGVVFGARRLAGRGPELLAELTSRALA